MKRAVQILPRAREQLDDAATWWAENRSLTIAARWLAGIEAAILSLGEDSERFPLAPESEKFEFPLRQLNFGLSRHPTHRVLFSVGKERVLVYAIRHLARQELASDELD